MERGPRKKQDEINSAFLIFKRTAINFQSLPIFCLAQKTVVALFLHSKKRRSCGFNIAFFVAGMNELNRLKKSQPFSTLYYHLSIIKPRELLLNRIS